MAKKLTVELMSEGSPVPGESVKVTGCTELETGPTGAVFFLVDEDAVSVTIGGQVVHSSSLDALPPKLSVVRSAGGWKLA